MLGNDYGCPNGATDMICQQNRGSLHSEKRIHLFGMDSWLRSHGKFDNQTFNI